VVRDQRSSYPIKDLGDGIWPNLTGQLNYQAGQQSVLPSWLGCPVKVNCRFFRVFAWCSDPNSGFDPTQRGHLKVVTRLNLTGELRCGTTLILKPTNRVTLCYTWYLTSCDTWSYNPCVTGYYRVPHVRTEYTLFLILEARVLTPSPHGAAHRVRPVHNRVTTSFPHDRTPHSHD
jgi:hypothetical protein